MKIPDIKGMISLARDLHESPQRVASQRPAATRPASDRVELSSQGQQVQQLTAQRTDQLQRSRLVEELKLKFQNGELDTDPQLTANAMLAEGLFDDLI
jgi:anti-sigma28 factor (negative regulator of flagellin synthesis)